MQSFAGLDSPELRSTVWFAATVAGALAVSLLLAFGFTAATRRHPSRDGALPSGIQRSASAPAPTTAKQRPLVSQPSALQQVSPPGQPRPLWALLTPWAFAVDVVAVLGLAAVLLVRSRRLRRGVRM